MSNSKTEIFIVDDEPLLTEMLRDYLKEQDASLAITSFPTGEACLQSLDQNPDLVVLIITLIQKKKRR
jgi:DNA-binding response OmpR family regulator